MEAQEPETNTEPAESESTDKEETRENKKDTKFIIIKVTIKHIIIITYWWNKELYYTYNMGI